MNLVKMLEDNEKDYILLVRCGAFFVGIGKNAIYLSEIRINCFGCDKYEKNKIIILKN